MKKILVGVLLLSITSLYADSIDDTEYIKFADKEAIERASFCQLIHNSRLGLYRKTLFCAGKIVLESQTFGGYFPAEVFQIIKTFMTKNDFIYIDSKKYFIKNNTIGHYRRTEK